MDVSSLSGQRTEPTYHSCDRRKRVSSTGRGHTPLMAADSFDALLATHDEDGTPPGVVQLTQDDLPEGDVLSRSRTRRSTTRTRWPRSRDGQVARTSPLVPGVDLAGTVIEGPGEGRRCWPTATTSAWRATAATPGSRACRPTGSCRCRTGSRARGDDPRHRRLHRRAERARADRPRGRARRRPRCSSPARPAAWAASRCRSSPGSATRWSRAPARRTPRTG